VWKEYLSLGELTDAERAGALFQVGALLEKAGLYDRAIENFYRSESVAKVSELESQINTHIKNCFEKLGKFSALRYELMERTSFEESEKAGGRVVAEIGAQKITDAQLSSFIEQDIDDRLSQAKAFLTDEQLNQQKKDMLERFKDPQTKMQYLQSWLAEELLYRQALKQKLSEKREVKRKLNRQSRQLLSRFLMNSRLADKINLTETDLRTYYKANKSDYLEPAKADISHILVDSRQQAENIIDRIEAGEEFARLAEEYSADEETKDNGGKIDTELTPGSYVPGLGSYPELNEQIFGTDAQALLPEPFKTEKGWNIIKVLQKQPERQKSFEQVRDEVLSTLLSQKRRDVQQDYIRKMMDKYNVVIHQSAFGKSQQGDSEEGSSEASK